MERSNQKNSPSLEIDKKSGGIAKPRMEPKAALKSKNYPAAALDKK
jgi:hypothetical protein